MSYITRAFSCLCVIGTLAGCSVFDNLGGLSASSSDARDASRTQAGSGYQPIDPVSLYKVPSCRTREDKSSLFLALPNETMLFALGTVDDSGTVTFGPVVVGVEGHAYTVVIDYMKYATTPLEIKYKEASDASTTGNHGAITHIIQELESPHSRLRVESERRDGITISIKGQLADSTIQAELPGQLNANAFETVHMAPVYVGVGVRLRVSVTVTNGSVNLSNLFTIGMAASEGRVHGSITLQTLGISGPTISAAIPLPNDLSSASIQNVLQAVGTIKSRIYDEDTFVVPQILGFDSAYTMPGSRAFFLATVQSTPLVGTVEDGGDLRFKFASESLRDIRSDQLPAEPPM